MSFEWIHTDIKSKLNRSLGNLYQNVDSVGTWGCVWDSQTRSKRFLPLWARSEFTWIDTGTNRNHKTKEFAKKSCQNVKGDKQMVTG